MRAQNPFRQMKQTELAPRIVSTRWNDQPLSNLFKGAVRSRHGHDLVIHVIRFEVMVFQRVEEPKL